MNVILMFVIAVVIGVGLAILFNKLVIKDYPEKRRKGKCVVTVIVFLLVSIALCGVLYGRAVTISAITEQANKFEQLIKDSSPNSTLVKEGYDLSKAPQVSSIVSDVRSLLPTATQLGMNKAIYNIVIDRAMSELSHRLAIIDYSAAKVTSSFTDENNILTVSSVIGGIRAIIINIVNNICLVIAGIIIALFLIYVIVAVVVAMKTRKITQATAPAATVE